MQQIIYYFFKTINLINKNDTKFLIEKFILNKKIYIK